MFPSSSEVTPKKAAHTKRTSLRRLSRPVSIFAVAVDEGLAAGAMVSGVALARIMYGSESFFIAMFSCKLNESINNMITNYACSTLGRVNSDMLRIGGGSLFRGEAACSDRQSIAICAAVIIRYRLFDSGMRGRVDK